MQTQTPPSKAIFWRARDSMVRDSVVIDTGMRRHSKLAPAAVGQNVWRSGILQLRGWLALRSSAKLIIAAGVLLCAPALATGLLLDDNFHAVALNSTLASVGLKRAPWDAFAFAKSPESIRSMIDESVFAWWSDPNARLSFFRPLTSLTHWLDHRGWPDAPVLMHIHSLLWYALLLVTVAGVYRRFSARSFSLGFAGLALLLYAFDDARAMSAGWIANRGALMALSCGFAALLAHDSWRSTARVRYLVAALALLSTGLLCAEAAVQVLGYFVAYALFMDTGSTGSTGRMRSRWWSLLPYGAVIALWRVAYVLMGYGAVGTGMYIDPARDPVQFAQAALTRLPILLAAQFVGLSADLGDVLKYAAPGLAKLLLPLCFVALALCIWVFSPLWSARREVRFWTVGTLLSTLPVCAAAPADRLLLATGLGGSALVAILILCTLDQARELGARARVYLTVALAIVNLVIAPLLLPVQAYALGFLDSYIGHAERTIPESSDIASKTVVLLNPPSDEYGVNMVPHRLRRGAPMPRHIRWLATADTDLLLTRVDRYTLKVKPSRGFLPPGSLWTLRSPHTPFHVGESLALDGVRYTVSDVTLDGRPAELVARFDEPLDSDELLWMKWDDHGGFEPFKLPAMGACEWVGRGSSASVFESFAAAD